MQPVLDIAWTSVLTTIKSTQSELLKLQDLANIAHKIKGEHTVSQKIPQTVSYRESEWVSNKACGCLEFC